MKDYYVYKKMLEKLARMERNNMEFNDLKAYGAAIESIKVYDKVGMIRKENKLLLGRYPRDMIRDSFLRHLA